MRPRLVLFGLAVAALVGLGLLLALSGTRRSEPPAAPTASEAEPTRSVRLSAAERRRARAALSAGAAADEGEAAAGSYPSGRLPGARAAARRFLAAFARYEVGDLSRALRAELRRTATPAFAAELLASPPHAITGGPRSLARTGALETQPIDRLGLRALVTGTLYRQGRAEPVSFLFERTPSGWLAASVGD